MRAGGGRRGQSALELLVLGGVAVSALVIMAVYVQRAYQGYLYSNGSAHGLQFDPRGMYTESSTVNSFQQTTDVTVKTGQQSVKLFSGTNDLPSTPGGQLPGRILETKVRAQTDWDISRNATYEAQ
ncbi:MAG: hypothetical protein HYZ91_07030 [Candidatus Omnitrophica bacterium]|nr:hypothetical protein [Candidatus Omnitrophota bacterium]